MKTRLSLLAAAVLTLATASAALSDEKKDNKSPLPGDATWDLKAFNSLFRVVNTEYDDEAKRVRWTVQTREGHRTSDFVRAISARPFTFKFLDADMKELAAVQLSREDFRGIPRDRLLKEGTRLEITLALPRAMPRTKQVILQRGRP
jgi:hypothetical protein